MKRLNKISRNSWSIVKEYLATHSVEDAMLHFSYMNLSRYHIQLISYSRSYTDYLQGVNLKERQKQSSESRRKAAGSKKRDKQDRIESNNKRLQSWADNLGVSLEEVKEIQRKNLAKARDAKKLHQDENGGSQEHNHEKAHSGERTFKADIALGGDDEDKLEKAIEAVEEPKEIFSYSITKTTDEEFDKFDRAKADTSYIRSKTFSNYVATICVVVLTIAISVCLLNM